MNMHSYSQFANIREALENMACVEERNITGSAESENTIRFELAWLLLPRYLPRALCISESLQQFVDNKQFFADFQSSEGKVSLASQPHVCGSEVSV